MFKVDIDYIKNRDLIPPQKIQEMIRIITDFIAETLKKSRFSDSQNRVSLILTAEVYYGKNYLTADIGIRRLGSLKHVSQYDYLYTDAVMLIEDTLHEFVWIDGWLHTQVIPLELLKKRLIRTLENQPYKY